MRLIHLTLVMVLVVATLVWFAGQFIDTAINDKVVLIERIEGNKK